MLLLLARCWSDEAGRESEADADEDGRAKVSKIYVVARKMGFEMAWILEVVEL